MLGVLVKKQLAEVFKSYFYDAKKNRMRSKWAIAAWFLFFFVIMVGFLGGIFTALSLQLCGGLTAIGMGWLYFLLMSGIAILLGALGSVFNTYSGLYLSKDNELLLSLPIPVRTIVAARLINVYLMGAMYAATVLLPALIVYWAVAGATAARVICGLALLLIATVMVLLLSCLRHNKCRLSSLQNRHTGDLGDPHINLLVSPHRVSHLRTLDRQDQSAEFPLSPLLSFVDLQDTTSFLHSRTSIFSL